MKQTVHSGLELIDSWAGMPGAKNTFDRVKRHRAKEGGMEEEDREGNTETEQKGVMKRKL